MNLATLRGSLDAIPLVDHHAHGILRAQPTLDEFRGLFSESPDPRQWPHVATGVTYRRAMRELGSFLGCDGTEATVSPLPVQVHCGFGDSDLHLARSDPSHLKPLIERFRETPFVLLHCYPFIREAGWLAHVYGNVFFDLSLTIPHVARPAEALGEALELAPVSKLLYASDAARTPELYYLASRWWREALAGVLAEALPAGEAERDGRAILRDNGLGLYRLEG